MGRIGNTHLVKSIKYNGVNNIIHRVNYIKTIDRIKDNYLVDELEKKNVKFNPNDLLFITKDRSGQIVWLETGSSTAGLEHIVKKHSEDFKKSFNISDSEIPSHIKKVISYGRIVDTNDSGIGYTKVYKYESKYYLITGIGYNGFIVSAFPYDDKGGKYETN